MNAPDVVVHWEDLVDGEEYIGALLNSTWCPVTSRWVLLVACFDDAAFKTVYSDQLGVSVYPAIDEVNNGP